MDASTLATAFTKKIESSGLTKAEAAKLGFEPRLDATKLGIHPQMAGFVIPYFAKNGSKIKHFRFRYLEDTRTHFEKLANAKLRRYSQPAKTGLEVYLPNIGAGEDWLAIMGDPSQPIILTEGELKAACACKHGFPTVGLGGVWAFKTDDKLLNFFDDVKWDGRKVFIIYDSDAVRNAQVNKAEQALAQELGRLGAWPHIVRLPENRGQKVGLDDFLVAHGAEALDQLIVDAEPFAEVAALHKLNEELILILNPSMVCERATGYLMNRQTLVSMNYADRLHYTERVGKDGSVTRKKVSSAAAWLEWQGRASARAITFAPGRPEFDEGNYNEWKGWGVEPDPAAGIKPWSDLLDYAFRNAPDQRRWFEQWAAYPLKYPGTKMATAVVMYGVREGTGKTLIGECLKRIYGQYGVLIGEEELHNANNDWAKNKQFVLGDEIAGRDRRGVADRLRTMITRSEVLVNIKYVPRHVVPDTINYYFTSNKPDAFIMSQTDRRYFVHEMNASPMPPEFYKRVGDWLDDGGAAALFAHLLTLDTTGFNPKAPAMLTVAKAEMQRHGQSDIMMWALDVISNPSEFLPKGRDIFTAADLLMLYDPEGKKRATVGGIGRVLKEAGIEMLHGYPMKVGNSTKRLYALRNRDHWERGNNAVVEEHYLKGEPNGRKY